ncbi:DUF3103 family protein [Deinococcus arboris]|nr:DUF3103 family protein [Deinococcus arboris]
MTRFHLPAALSLGLLLAACGQQPATAPIAVTPTQTADQTQTNAALHVLAKQLARALSEPGVRTLIAQQTALKVTGDTEALYATLASQSTGKGTFAQALSSGLSTQSLSALVSKVPNLHIADRGAVWDADTTIPLVAVATEGGDEYAPVTAYDAQGHVHLLDSRKTPSVPVIAVGVNERVDAQGTILPQSPQAPWPKQQGSDLSAQACFGTRLVRLDVIDDMEPFVRGHAEVYVAVKGAGIGWHGRLPMVTEPGIFLDAQQYFGCADGDVHFYWYERDGGAANHVIMFGPFNFGWQNDNEDDFMGGVKMQKNLFDGTSTDVRDLGNLKQYTD